MKYPGLRPSAVSGWTLAAGRKAAAYLNPLYRAGGNGQASGLPELKLKKCSSPS